jgi:hypothetical protein
LGATFSIRGIGQNVPLNALISRAASRGPVDLGFLGSGRFAAKSPDSAYWISLEFLGFSRPK